MSVAQWKYVAMGTGGVILSLFSFFFVSYINKVEALEDDAAYRKGVLERVADDVRWMKDHWGDR